MPKVIYTVKKRNKYTVIAVLKTFFSKTNYSFVTYTLYYIAIFEFEK